MWIMVKDTVHNAESYLGRDSVSPIGSDISVGSHDNTVMCRVKATDSGKR